MSTDETIKNALWIILVVSLIILFFTNTSELMQRLRTIIFDNLFMIMIFILALAIVGVIKNGKK